MLALRRARLAASPPFLRGGFRPFFFGGAAWAVVALVLWLAVLSGATALPSALDSLAWHRHEMLFGFVGAVICGFLLTAIPNWTGRLPIAGSPLAALFTLWLAARLALLFSSVSGIATAAVLDVGFYILLACLFAREVVSTSSRNLPIVGLVFLFGIANALDYAGAAGILSDAGLGYRAGITLVVLMISLVGGRIVPSFTRNWLSKQSIKDRLPAQPGRFDFAVIALTAAAMFTWTASPHNRLAGTILTVAAIFQAMRLGRWQGLRAAADPLVLILHVGYAWVPIGLGLLGGSILTAAVPESAAVHALTAGAMATMILAVMTRATLGHTGRELKADRATVFLYLLVTLGAVLRVAAPFGLFDYMGGIELAGLAWVGAFLIFLITYGPMLLRPRVDDRM
ncbi:MAG TPA: NnrS family protein [Sphingomicrobium sp.]|nr:NnrS family protein [Sphingomicrobium sp.]